MTECQGCGAWNERRRTHCVLCDTPLAETDEWEATAELPPLPPLPDGGLSATMPAWLRDLPGVAAPEPEAVIPEPLPLAASVATASSDAEPPLGPLADPRTFLTDDDFPAWIRALASRSQQPAAPAPVEPTNWPAWPAHPVAPPAPLPQPHPVAVDQPQVVVASATSKAVRQLAPSEPPQPREQTLWETILLILLGLGIVGAALWALVSYGVLSFGI